MSGRLGQFFVLVCGLMLSGGASFASSGQLRVVATHGILADVARNIAGDQAEVSSLIPVGAEQHGFMPTPSDLTMVAKADLVLINGAGFEASLLDALESAGEGGNIVNASACAQIRPFGASMGHDDHADEAEEADDDHDDDEHAEDEDHATDDHDDDNEHAEGEHDDEHADDEDYADDDDDDDHAHEDHDDEMADEIDCDDHDAEFAAIVGEEEDGQARFMTLGRGGEVDCLGAHEHGAGHEHEAGACDPHLWMDPHNVIYWALMIRDTLAGLDHDNEDAYVANAAAYAQEMVALEADFILSALEELPEANRVLITSHESLGYFATTFGFEIITTVLPGMATMVDPSARDVAAMIDLVRAEGVPAIFSDAHLSDVLVNTIASETGVAVVGLHTDTLSDAYGPAATYIDYMHYNVTTIIDALKGEWR